MDTLRTLYSSVTEVSPKEVMGALMVGLILALVCYGICILGRKRLSDPLPMLCGLFFVVSLLSMAVGFGHSRSRLADRQHMAGRGTNSIGPSRSARSEAARLGLEGLQAPSFGKTLLLEADADGNGLLTPDEAAAFVRLADKLDKGWVDAASIDQARRKSLPTPRVEGHPSLPTTNNVMIPAISHPDPGGD